jgi:hypothetical protein
MERGGVHNNNSIIVACIFIATGTCLLSHCLETVAVYLPYPAAVAQQWQLVVREQLPGAWKQKNLHC